jgi:hypothetical protein
MRLIHVLVSLVLLCIVPAGLARDGGDRSGPGGGESGGGGRTTVEGILVVASNQPGPSDDRLAPYEPTLRRILNFKSYRMAGEGSTTIGIPGEGDFSLGRGQRIEIETEASGGAGVRTRVRWLDGGRQLMNTVLVLRRGVPAVLGGPSRGESGEVYAVIITAS